MSFVLNRWVRGQDFFGRKELLESLRNRSHKPTWILGNRRSGKTSLLRQVEWLCGRGDWGDCATLFWDLQGAGSAEGLKESLLESLEDSPKTAARLGLDPSELEDLELGELLSRFRRKVKSYEGERLLLLVDECEELVELARKDPSLLGGLRKLVSATERFCMVLAGSVRLMDMDETTLRTSPFLPDFLPALPLLPLNAEESAALLAHHGLSAELAAEIHALTFGNPHLTQALGEAWRRLGDREAALAELEQARVTRYFFDSNFTCLVEELRESWRRDHRALLAELAGMGRDHANFVYVQQSALVRIEQGETKVNPLLIKLATGEWTWHASNAPGVAKVEGPASATEPAGWTSESGTEAQSTAMSNDTPMPETAPSRPESTASDGEPLQLRQAMAVWAERLQGWSQPLLPSQEAGQTPEMPGSFTSKLKAPNDELHALLDRAAPEYLRNEAISGRTLVYLFGLALLGEIGQAPPFREISSALARAEAITRSVPQIRLAEKASSARRMAAMVALRCLQPRALARYESLDQALNDL